MGLEGGGLATGTTLRSFAGEIPEFGRARIIGALARTYRGADTRTEGATLAIVPRCTSPISDGGREERIEVFEWVDILD